MSNGEFDYAYAVLSQQMDNDQFVDSNNNLTRDVIFGNILKHLKPNPLSIFQVGAIETFNSNWRIGSGWSDIIFGKYMKENGGELTVVDINLESGWNWISVNVSNEDMTVNNVFSTVGAEGDYVKSQGGFADYYDGFGWYGTLGTLNPFEGYMVQLASGGTLVYPEGSGMARTADYDNQINSLDFNYRDYEFNGSVTAAVFNSDINIGEDGDMVVCFVNGEQRGVGITSLIPFGPYEGTYQFQMMIYSNQSSGENIIFQYYDASLDEVYFLKEIDSLLANKREQL